jgi:hypothetical protein
VRGRVVTASSPALTRPRGPTAELNSETSIVGTRSAFAMPSGAKITAVFEGSPSQDKTCIDFSALAKVYTSTCSF